jgi:two-component system, OmpR family, phosphate regulon response regulator PhoB
MRGIGMTNIAIICLEDDRDVLDALPRDMQPFADTFPIEATETAEEARGVVRDLLHRGQQIGLVLADHILPGENGVEFLVDLNHDSATEKTRKVLVTAQAGLQDTIKAVNEANLDHYIAKPWSLPDLHETVRHQLTDYVLECGLDPLPFMKVLQTTRLLEAMRQRGADQ